MSTILDEYQPSASMSNWPFLAEVPLVQVEDARVMSELTRPLAAETHSTRVPQVMPQNRMSAPHQTNADIVTPNQGYMKTLNELSEKYSELTRENRRLESDRREAVTELAHWRQTARSESSTRAFFQQAVAEKCHRLSELEAKEKMSNETIARLSTVIHNLSCSEPLDDLAKMREENSEQQSYCAQLQSQISSLQDEIEVIVAKFEECRQGHAQYRAYCEMVIQERDQIIRQLQGVGDSDTSQKAAEGALVISGR